MLSNKYAHKLIVDGFVVVPNYLSEFEIAKVAKEISTMNEREYTEDNLSSGIAYPSDSTETRTSNAYLIGNGNCYFPHINLLFKDYPVIENILDDWNSLVAQMEGGVHYEQVADTSTLINFQEYKEESKPVTPHMDGHYLDFNISEDGEMSVTEALIAKYVGVVTLYNENDGGTVLTEVDSGEVHSPELGAGDMIIFDNVRFLHSVPTLKKNRSMLGLRNFTFSPYRFTQKRVAPVKTHIGNFFSGYMKQINDSEAAMDWVNHDTGYDEAPF